jgi:hypothetical protein
MTDDKAMPELLPCPFCGGEADYMKGPPGCHWIRCMTCHAHSDDGNLPEIKWNRRTALSAPPVPEWMPCTPELLRSGIDCATAPRRTGDGTYSHDHLVLDHLNYLEGDCLDLRCESDSTCGDDADIVWKVYEHHIGKNPLRLIGIGKTPKEAIENAAAPKKPEAGE